MFAPATQRLLNRHQPQPLVAVQLAHVLLVPHVASVASQRCHVQRVRIVSGVSGQEAESVGPQKVPAMHFLAVLHQPHSLRVEHCAHVVALAQVSLGPGP